jgi:hypothetical protein
MAKLEKTVHLALDELRMQMLGTQVLFGFQLQGVFQERFAQASVLARWTDLCALSLLVITLGFLIAAPCQHRLVERGNATHRIFRVAERFAELALAPFALAIGCDLFMVSEPYFGTPAAATGAASGAIIALFLCYGLGAILKSILPRKETTMPLPPHATTDLHEKIDQMLTEARVILPGAQALLGFQFAVTMTKAFATLPAVDRDIHFFALAMETIAIMVLLTPAAVHRMTFGGVDAERFHDIGSGLLTIALAPLALGIAADFYIAAYKMLGDVMLAAGAAALAALFLAGLWYALPLALRGTSKRKAAQ